MELFVLAALIIAILALRKGSKLDTDLQAIKEEMIELRSLVFSTAKTTEHRGTTGEKKTSEAKLTTETEVETQVESEPSERFKPEGHWGPATYEPSFAEPSPPVSASRGEPADAAPKAAWVDISSGGESLEHALTSRWIVWLGALAIALAGVFLTAYAIEQGWLGPTTRIVLGCLLGLTLAVGGEWVRRRPFERTIASVRVDYVPQALSSAGVFVLYASIYVGYAYYELYPALISFILLGAVALGAVAFSLLQGWFVAFLGILGSFLTPALTPSPTPSAWALFPYLIAVLAASIAVMRYMGWWWLGFFSLAAATLWNLVWLATTYTGVDAPAVGLYILLTGSLYQALRIGLKTSGVPIRFPLQLHLANTPENHGWAGLLASAFMLFCFVRADHYGDISLLTLGIFAAGTGLLARLEPAFDEALLISALVTLVLFMTWHIGYLGTADSVLVDQITRYDAQQSPIIEPTLQRFSSAAVIFGTLFGLGGYAALWRVQRTAVWAAVSAIVPVALFAIAYWRFLGFETNTNWAVVSVVLAAVYLAAAFTVFQRLKQSPAQYALGLYVAAVFACISLGMAMTLRDAWLTVALSLQLPVLAWIHNRLDLPALRYIAWVFCVIVLVRLVGNPSIFYYAHGSGFLLMWVLYGYGIPAIAFHRAAITFARSANDLLVAVLESGALIFFILLVTFEIRYLVTGSIINVKYALTEQSLQSIAWLLIACGLLAGGSRVNASRQPIQIWGALILLGIATAQVFILQVFLFNPALTHEPVGELPFVNLLLLAYFVPGVLAICAGWLLRARGFSRLANVANIASLLLLFLYLTLEVKHWFQGSVLDVSFSSDAESYGVSAVWLVYALVLLGGGIILRNKWLRFASLGVLLAAVAKVFIGDMAGLTGLYRVASFLGLGLCLVGIGYVYQRFVFASGAARATAAGEPDVNGGTDQG